MKTDFDESQIQHRNEILLAIVDGRQVTKKQLGELPPWIAYLYVQVAGKAGADMEITPPELKELASEVKENATYDQWQKALGLR